VVLFTPDTHLLHGPRGFRGARRVVVAIGRLPAARRFRLLLLKEPLPVEVVLVECPLQPPTVSRDRMTGGPRSAGLAE